MYQHHGINMEEIVLYTVPLAGFVEVTYPAPHALEDADLREEMVNYLVDTLFPEQAVDLLVRAKKATKESAIELCLEMANDLLVGEVNLPRERDPEEDRPGLASDPGEFLIKFLDDEKKKKREKPYYRHAGVANKTYIYRRIDHFYTLPENLNKSGKIRIKKFLR
jgi:hypothetical protein